MRYSPVKVLLKVSPLRPSFPPNPVCISTPSILLTLCFHTLLSCPSSPIDLHLLHFQMLTNPFLGNLFVLITICVALCFFGPHLLPNSWILCASVVKRSLTLFRSYSCKLFGGPKKTNSFAIRQIRTLSAKHPGWGYIYTCKIRGFGFKTGATTNRRCRRRRLCRAWAGRWPRGAGG
jgi:hypothetical protein